MKALDCVGRVLVRSQGSAQRWLRTELADRGVNIPLTSACLGELAREADRVVCRDLRDDARSYVQKLRAQCAVQAEFILRWTGSDADMGAADGPTLHGLVRIARQHALPRRWKLTEPVVKEYRRKRPSYFQWTDDLDPATVAH